MARLSLFVTCLNDFFVENTAVYLDDNGFPSAMIATSFFPCI